MPFWPGATSCVVAAVQDAAEGELVETGKRCGARPARKKQEEQKV